MKRVSGKKEVEENIREGKTRKREQEKVKKVYVGKNI